MVGLAAAIAVLSGATAAAAPLTIQVSPAVLVVGTQANVVVAPGTPPSERMTIEMKQCGSSSWSTAAAARSWPDGYWTAGLHPLFNALIRARVRDVTSTPVQVQVRPYVNLDILKRPWFRVEVGAGRYLPGKRVYLERFAGGTWKRTASTRLSRERSHAWATSSAKFRARVSRGTRIRVVVPGTRCYLQGVSNVQVAE
jgi:hypothetical protein